MSEIDGRKLRGERKRAEIIEATLRVIERGGVAGVTHRTVAREAGLPTTSSTYYFATLDELLVAALTTSCDAMAEQAAALLATDGATVRVVADMLADYLGTDRARALAEYELYLFAARRPELRPAARRWLDSIGAVLRPYVADEARIGVILAAIDGMLIQGLIAERPPTAEQLRPLLAQLLDQPVRS